ncbi:MAG: glycoside hydrolase [Planctomycetota bacterium]
MRRQIITGAGLVLFSLAGFVDSAEVLQAWQQPAAVEEKPFALGTGKGEYKAWGRDKDYRVFFPEFLPALFERTVALDRFDANCGLVWIFTGEHGGFTVTIAHNQVSLYQRFYDSPGFERRFEGKRLRHPEKREPAAQVEYAGRLRAVTVKMNYKLGLSVALNGKALLQQECLLDVSRHQLRLTGGGEISGRMLEPAAEPAVVRINPDVKYQRMMGFGGITTPTAYAQLSAEGKRRWWKLVCEYNLLIQREYPIGRRLNPKMDNWDKLEDATPHYYGDNFPNGEVSDFEYIRTLRRLGGKILFEFWALPPWTEGAPEKYAEAMVDYCKASKEKAGAPPDIVGIQNEKRQTEQMWHKMTLALRRKLDEAGFAGVRIHMSDAGTLAGGIKRAKAFRASKQVWAAIDYSATHMYDYQKFFTDPDGFDALLTQWKELAGDKPFLSTELCINSDKYQWPTYRVALAMGQLYHKNLVLTDASAVCYCWTLLNVVQPSFGWTRTLTVPDRSHGFIPVAPSHQLRVFGAFSRRIHEGMTRIEAGTDVDHLLVSAFAGKGNKGTVVILNRSTRSRAVRVSWPGVTFAQMELVDPYHENEMRATPVAVEEGVTEVTAEPGSIVTLTNAALGKVPGGVIAEIE